MFSTVIARAPSNLATDRDWRVHDIIFPHIRRPGFQGAITIAFQTQTITVRCPLPASPTNDPPHNLAAYSYVGHFLHQLVGDRSFRGKLLILTTLNPLLIRTACEPILFMGRPMAVASRNLVDVAWPGLQAEMQSQVQPTIGAPGWSQYSRSLAYPDSPMLSQVEASEGRRPHATMVQPRSLSEPVQSIAIAQTGQAQSVEWRPSAPRVATLRIDTGARGEPVQDNNFDMDTDTFLSDSEKQDNIPTASPNNNEKFDQDDSDFLAFTNHVRAARARLPNIISGQCLQPQQEEQSSSASSQAFGVAVIKFLRSVEDHAGEALDHLLDSLRIEAILGDDFVRE